MAESQSQTKMKSGLSSTRSSNEDSLPWSVLAPWAMFLKPNSLPMREPLDLLEPEHVEVARGDHADDGGSAGGGGADGGGALVEGAARGLGGLAEDAAELHELGFRLLEAAELAVGLLIDDGRDAAQFGDLLDEAAAHEDDVGFARHEGLEVDFLGRAGVDDLRVVLVLREPGKGRGLRQGGHAVAEAPGVHGVEDGVVKDGDALRVLRNDDLDGRVLLVEGLHREGFGRLDGDGGQGGDRDEERGERAGEHGLHGFPVCMETVVERCAWMKWLTARAGTQW